MVSRYMHYWAQHQLSSFEGHAFIWGAELGNTGSRPDDVMQLLWDFFGATRLEDVSASVRGPAGNDVYAFRSVSDPSKVAVMYFAQGPDRDVGAGSVALGFTPGASSSGRVYTFGTSGMQAATSAVTHQGSGVAVGVPNAGRAVIVLIGR
jgi:hypothetical protein